MKSALLSKGVTVKLCRPVLKHLERATEERVDDQTCLMLK